MTCRIPTYFSQALCLPSVFSGQASPLVTSGRSVVMSLMSLPHRTPLLSEQMQMLKLRSNAPWPQPKRKQMRALRLVPHE